MSTSIRRSLTKADCNRIADAFPVPPGIEGRAVRGWRSLFAVHLHRDMGGRTVDQLYWDSAGWYVDVETLFGAYDEFRVPKMLTERAKRSERPKASRPSARRARLIRSLVG